jgi:hypothetical protein
MIDNIEIIKPLLNFENEGDFYVLLLLLLKKIYLYVNGFYEKINFTTK